jgi:hypothetical protein
MDVSKESDDEWQSGWKYYNVKKIQKNAKVAFTEKKVRAFKNCFQINVILARHGALLKCFGLFRRFGIPS